MFAWHIGLTENSFPLLLIILGILNSPPKTIFCPWLSHVLCVCAYCMFAWINIDQCFLCTSTLFCDRKWNIEIKYLSILCKKNLLTDWFIFAYVYSSINSNITLKQAYYCWFEYFSACYDWICNLMYVLMHDYVWLCMTD